ncbi:MAG: phosphate/phosphite/phosphonate ABC transporter substrate-binding protein [Magnetococcus sp. YQC-5]
MKKIKIRGCCVGWVLLSLIVCWPAVAKSEDVIRLGVIPLLNSLELTEKFGPMLGYLEKRLGQPVKLKVPANFRLLIDALGENQLEIVYLGPVPYLHLVEQYGLKPILAMEELKGKKDYHGVIFVRQESPIQGLGDLAGKRFAFGDPESTMNHTLPKLMLAHAGVGLKDLAKHAFVGNNQNVVLSVLMGQFDAAGVKEDVYAQYESRGLRVIAKSLPVPNLMFVAGSHMPKEWVERVREAMTSMHQTPEGMAALKKFHADATALIPSQDSDFKPLRAFLQENKKK